MRVSRSLLAQLTTASARRPERFLTAGDPTGLTGVVTHPCPRSALIYLYQTTLKSLSEVPSSSAYKTATTNLTNHRLKIVESTRPAGYDQWRAKAQTVLDENREAFSEEIFDYGEHAPEAAEARRLFRRGLQLDEGPYSRQYEWDGAVVGDEIEGMRAEGEFEAREARLQEQLAQQSYEGQEVEFEDCPPLESSQISEIEEKIGAGLIEEIIEVAKGELYLTRTMKEAKVWEELEEKVPEGQWQYFARATHMPSENTQKPS